MNQSAASAQQARTRSGGRLTTVEDEQLSDELAQVDDFAGDAEPRRRRWFVRPVLTSVVATVLSVGVAAGVFAAASSRSTAQNQSRLVVDHQQSNDSKAKPLNGKLDAQQQNNNGSKDVNTQFGAAGTSVNRSSVRAELSKAMTSDSADNASISEYDTSKKLTAEQAKAQQLQRIKDMDEAVAKAKAQADKIRKEQEAAKKRLQEEAAKKKAANQAGNKEAPPPPPVNGSDPSVAASGKGGASPIKAGQYTLSAHFGQYGPWARYHTGQDFAAGCGTTVYAAADGIVGSPVGAGWAGPNALYLTHINGGATLYAHMQTRLVQDGQSVKAGQPIANVGNMGNSFGCHLHFEYYPPGATPGNVYAASDPRAFLASVGVSI